MSGGVNTELSRTVGLNRNDASLSDFEALTTNRKHNKGTLVFSKTRGAYDSVYVLKCTQNHRLVNFGGVSVEQIREVTDSFKNAVAKELDTIVDRVRKANLNGFDEASMMAKVENLKRSFATMIDNKNGGAYEFRALRREEIAAFIVQVKAITRDMSPEKLLLRSAEQLADVAAQVHHRMATASGRNTAQFVVVGGGAWNNTTDATIGNFALLTTGRNHNKGVLRFDMSGGRVILKCQETTTILNRMHTDDAALVRDALKNAVDKELETLLLKAHVFGMQDEVSKKKVEKLKEKFGQMITIRDVNAPCEMKPLERKEIGKIVEMVLKLTRETPVDEVLSMSVNEIRMPEEVAARFRRAGADEAVVRNDLYAYARGEEAVIDGDGPLAAKFSDFSGLTTNRVYNKGTLVFSRGMGKLVLKCAQHHNSLMNIGRVSQSEAQEVCDAFKNAVNEELDRRINMSLLSGPGGVEASLARSIRVKIETLQSVFNNMITIENGRAPEGWKPLERKEIGRIVRLVQTIGNLPADRLLALSADRIFDEAQRILQEDPMPAEVVDDSENGGYEGFEDLNLADIEAENIPASGAAEVPRAEAHGEVPKTYRFTPEECSERGLRILEGIDPLAVDSTKNYLHGCLTEDKEGFAKFLNGEVFSEELSDVAKDNMIRNALQKYADAFRQYVDHGASDTNYTHDDIGLLVKANLRVNNVWTSDAGKKEDFMLSVLNGLSLTEKGVSHLKSRFVQKTDAQTGVVENILEADERMMDPRTGKEIRKKQQFPFVKIGYGSPSFERTVLQAYRHCTYNVEVHVPGTPGNVREFARILGLRPAGTELLDGGANGNFKARHTGVKLCNALKSGLVCVLTTGEGNDRRSQTIANVYHNSNSGKTMIRLIDSASGSVSDVSLNELIGVGGNRIDVFEIPD